MRKLPPLTPLALVALLVASACGGGQPAATPTPTPALAAVATPTPTPEPTPIPIATPTATPTVAPATGKIAFHSARDGIQGGQEIYVMDDDGSGQTNLSNNPAQDTLPAWSPVP